MLITNECDYAVRIIRALSKNAIVSVQDISSEEVIPMQYTYKICRKLTKANIIKSHRGSTGGYELCKSPEEMTLYDVFMAIDSTLQVSDCTQEGHICERNTSEHKCKVHIELCRLQNVIVNEFKSKKISELI